MLLLASMNNCVYLFVAWECSLIDFDCSFILALPKVASLRFSLITSFIEHGNTSIWFISTRLFVDLPSLFTSLSSSLFPYLNSSFCLFCCFFLKFLSFFLVTIHDVYYYSVQYPSCYYRSTLPIRNPLGRLFLSEVLSVDSFFQKSFSVVTIFVWFPFLYCFVKETFRPF